MDFSLIDSGHGEISYIFRCHMFNRRFDMSIETQEMPENSSTGKKNRRYSFMNTATI